MHLRRVPLLTLVSVVLGLTWTPSAQADVREVYDAILHGDYQAGSAELARLLEADPPGAPVLRVKGWLDSFQRVVGSREELREETFRWNVEHAKTVLSEEKTYLALSFAAQAHAYAADKKAYAAEPWVQDLKQKALAAARELEQDEHWAAVHAHYVLLERLYPDDEQLSQQRERAARHLRLKLLYEDAESVERRMKGVTQDLMETALWRISENYYERPDFKCMAEGALEYLVALCQTTKLYDIHIFDGVANPVAREYFLGKIEEKRREMLEQEQLSFRGLIRLFNDLHGYNQRSVSLPKELLIIEFAEGALSELSELDGFTSVVWPADVRDFDKAMTGSFTGVGIQLGVHEITGRLKVVTPLEDSPALEAGIQPEDLIVEVDGESTEGWTTIKAVDEITGEAGTKVVLTMHRPSTGERIPFPLIRRQINLRTVRGVQRIPAEAGSTGWDYTLDREQGIAYIRLTGFNPNSYGELAEALKAAERQGMKALILDLRFNPGGLLEVAIQVVSAFVGQGEVVHTLGRQERRRHKVLGDPLYEGLPLVVLVNGHSASASEIIAGALRDHKRAIVLGERTYGKGSVQRVLPLGPSARLKLTTALYYLPNGRTPNKTEPDADVWGVDPDVQIELTPKEQAKLLELQRAAYIITTNGDEQAAAKVDEESRQEELEALRGDADEEEEGDFRLLTDADLKLLQDDPYKAPDADPQLETALLHLRVKLAGNLPWPQQVVAKSKRAGAP